MFETYVMQPILPFLKRSKCRHINSKSRLLCKNASTNSSSRMGCSPTVAIYCISTTRTKLCGTKEHIDFPSCCNGMTSQSQSVQVHATNASSRHKPLYLADPSLCVADFTYLPSMKHIAKKCLPSSLLPCCSVDRATGKGGGSQQSHNWSALQTPMLAGSLFSPNW